jgi:isoleucyl-tRNA synthetase
MDASVLLDLQTNENLEQMGMRREIVNKIQRLRKAAGLNIEDSVEIYFHVKEGSVFNKVLTT